MTYRLLVLLALISSAPVEARFESEQHDFELEVIADNLDHPWALQFLPGGDYLVSERPGNLKRISTTGEASMIAGVPPVAQRGQGGLLDIRLDPSFADNKRLYLCYADGDLLKGYGTELAAVELHDNRLDNVEVLFKAVPKVSGGRHFGCRIEFDNEGYLYLSLGDRGQRDNAQNPATHHGSIIRLNADGSIPADNPFIRQQGALPELYTLGNRNPQGMVRHPQSGRLYEIEHGPRGGDELNIVKPGANYGWPVVSFGKEYVSGMPVSESTHMEGMMDPLYYWDPSIAPSGMAFYRGSAFPKWNSSLFVGSLKFNLLVRLEMDGDKVISEERLLEDEIGRIRDVRVDANGFVYLLTDEDKSKLVRLVPVR